MLMLERNIAALFPYYFTQFAYWYVTKLNHVVGVMYGFVFRIENTQEKYDVILGALAKELQICAFFASAYLSVCLPICRRATTWKPLSGLS